MSGRLLARSQRNREAAVAGAEPASKPAHRFLDATEIRYILIEIVIVATGVFVALLVDEVRQSSDHRSLAAETRSALHEEAVRNRARMAHKLYILRDAARTLETDPSRAAELVEARRNDVSRPRDTAWTIARQNDALRYLQPDERRRITDTYVAEAVYTELVDQEMNAWTQLAGTAGTDADREEARQRDHAIHVWRAYAGRVALAACIVAVRIEGQLSASISEDAGSQLCRGYPVTGDPAVIYRALRVPPPPLRPVAG